MPANRPPRNSCSTELPATRARLGFSRGAKACLGKLVLVGGILTACLAVCMLVNASLFFAGTNVWSVAGEIAPTQDDVASIAGIQNFIGTILTLTKG